MLVEVCVSSLQSIKNAHRAGADRIELCTALGIGGITPSQGFIREAVGLDLLPIHCLIRPRESHFFYSESECQIIEQDILTAKELGCAGVVVGALTSEFTLDVKRLGRWKELAGMINITFHRAFDVVVNPFEALEQLIELGYDCILTSGQEEKALSGFDNLERLHKQAGDRITIMPGSGINEKNSAQFKTAGFRAIHLSGSQNIPPIPIPKNVNHELSFLSQPIGESSEKIIKAVVGS
jgi:copper homeostasis protein